MNHSETQNFYITQEMIIGAEQSHDWTEIKTEGEKVLAAGGKVVVGVTEFVKEIEFSNWLSMAEEHGK